MKKILLIASLLILSLCLFTQAKAGENVNPTYLDTISYVDPGLGGEAFRMIVPRGWRYEGGLFWRKERPLLPVSLCFRVSNPQAIESIECFPDQAYFWVQSKGTSIPFDYTAQMQQMYAASFQGYMAASPVNAATYITSVVIPFYRRSATNLRVVNVVSLNNTDIVANLYRQLMSRPQGSPFAEQVSVDAAKVRVNYQEGGRDIEEELWAMIVCDTQFTPAQMAMNSGVNMQSTFWYADWLWSIKKEKNRLSPLEGKLFMTVFSSFRWNGEWLSRYTGLLTELWSKYLQATMERNEIIRQSQNEIARIISSTFTNQQNAMERIAKQWSEYIRGTGTYSEPQPGLAEFGSPGVNGGVELPNGYNYAWANKTGGYVFTDSISFNPNIGSNVEWDKLERKH